MARTKVELIHTSDPRSLVAADNKMVEIAKQTTPEAMDNTGMLPNLNIGGIGPALYGPGWSAWTSNGWVGILTRWPGDGESTPTPRLLI